MFSNLKDKFLSLFYKEEQCRRITRSPHCLKLRRVRRKVNLDDIFNEHILKKEETNDKKDTD